MSNVWITIWYGVSWERSADPINLLTFCNIYTGFSQLWLNNDIFPTNFPNVFEMDLPIVCPPLMQNWNTNYFATRTVFNSWWLTRYLRKTILKSVFVYLQQTLICYHILLNHNVLQRHARYNIIWRINVIFCQ